MAKSIIFHAREGGGYERDDVLSLAGGGGLGPSIRKKMGFLALLCVLMLFHALETRFRSLF